MAKKIAARQYFMNESGQLVAQFVECNRSEVLDILNCRENVPEDVKVLPANFVYFDFTENADSGELESLLVKYEGCLSMEALNFVNTILGTDVNEKLASVLCIKHKKNRKNRKVMKADMFQALSDAVNETDKEKRAVLVSNAVEIVNELLA